MWRESICSVSCRSLYGTCAALGDRKRLGSEDGPIPSSKAFPTHASPYIRRDGLLGISSSLCLSSMERRIIFSFGNSESLSSMMLLNVSSTSPVILSELSVKYNSTSEEGSASASLLGASPVRFSVKKS